MDQTRRPARFVWLGSLLAAAIWLPAFAFVHLGLLDRQPPVDRVSGRVASVATLPDGTRLMWVEWTYRRLRACAGRTERWLVDGVRLSLPEAYVAPADNETPGGTYTLRVPVEVPPYFHARGTYRVRTAYQCNRLQAEFPDLLSIVADPPGIPFDLSRPGGNPLPSGNGR